MPRQVTVGIRTGLRGRRERQCMRPRSPPSGGRDINDRLTRGGLRLCKMEKNEQKPKPLKEQLNNNKINNTT